MRLNQFLAASSQLSRRAADLAIERGEVKVNGQTAQVGQQIDPDADQVELAGRLIQASEPVTILFNKPVGVVTSRDGQGSQTIYDLLPPEYQLLKPAGRLDKDSSGLLILSSDGQLINKLIHPSSGHNKEYRVTLDRPLGDDDGQLLAAGVKLEEGTSRLTIVGRSGVNLTLTMETGWNQQIRRTFEALGYQVTNLERLSIGEISLGNLATGQTRAVSDQEAAWLNSL